MQSVLEMVDLPPPPVVDKKLTFHVRDGSLMIWGGGGFRHRIWFRLCFPWVTGGSFFFLMGVVTSWPPKNWLVHTKQFKKIREQKLTCERKALEKIWKKITGLSEFYVLHDLFDFSHLQTNVFLHSTGFLRGLLQATKAFFLQFSRLNFRLLQSTDLKNSPITVYEKSINPPLNKQFVLFTLQKVAPRKSCNTKGSGII